MTDTYYNSAEDTVISKARALLELKRHGTPESEFSQFFKDCGDFPTYTAQFVLRWLGY